MEKAMFAAGCFWGPEERFRRLKGVRSTMVGYAGGHVPNPSYEEVCAGHTGHAETILVEYDPEEISYDELLNAFGDMHDPTTLNRQGPDIGEQYRSAIFYYSPEQKEAAERSRMTLEATRKYTRPITTEISPASDFYRAEEYHQCYLQKRGY